MRQMRNAYRILVRKLKDVNIGRPRQRLENNIKKDIKEIGCENVN
jgi:hypothetical protein